MTIVHSDTFTNTNGTDLDVHDSNWVHLRGDDVLEIQSNAYVATGGGEEYYRYNDTFDNDQYAQVDITASAGYKYGVVVVRAVGTSGDSGSQSFYLYEVDTADGGYLEKHVAGSYSLIDSGGSTINSGDTIKLTAEGTSLKCYINDSEDTNLTNTDSSLSSGDAGCGTYDGNASFSGDDWEGGNLGVTDLSVSNIKIKEPAGLPTPLGIYDI